MASLEGLLGGGGDQFELYGDLLTDKQKAALREQQITQGLLGMADRFGKLAMPSRAPVPFGAILGQGLAGMGGDPDQALKGIQTAAQIRELQAKAKIREQMFGPEANAKLDALFRALGGVSPGAPSIAPRAAPGGGAPGGGASGASSYPGGPGTGPPPPATAVTPDADLMGGYGGGPPATPAPGSAGLLSPPLGGLPGPGILAQLASYGGGAPGGAPFEETAPGPDGAERRVNVRPLSGTAAPADAWMRANAPDAVKGPNSPTQHGWTYEQPTVTPRPEDYGPGSPFGERPPAALNEADRLSALMKVETLAKPAERSGYMAERQPSWEIANNNLGGMRRPGVNASPSQGGFQSFATPEEGLAGISRQLDRYASGATTGRPLSTIREIVSTWAPPHENPTEKLIDRAVRVMGVGDNIPLNLSDPAVKAKLIEAIIRNEQGDRLPVDPALIAKVANAPPGSVAAIDPNRRVNVRPLGGEAAPAGGSGMPPLPGLPSAGGMPAVGGNPQAMNLLLLELSRRNAAAEALGMGNPYGSMLQVLQGTPQYKAMIESATRAAGLPFRREEAAETAAGNWPTDIGKIQYQGQVNATLKQLEQIGAAGLDLADIPVPDGKGGTIVRQGTRAQGVMVANGFDVPEIGFKGIHGPMPGASAVQAAGGAGGEPPALAGKPQVSEADKARIGIDAQLAKEVGDQALQARRLLPLLDEALALARKTPEGLAGPASAQIGRIASAFGIAPTPGQSNAELLGAINQRLIPLVREPGAQSNAEMDAYLIAGPALMATADGRVKIAEMTKAIGQRAIAIAEVYRDTIGEPSSARRAKLDALDKPLFTPEQRAAMETASRPPAPAAAAGFASQPAATAPLPPPLSIDKEAYDKLPPGTPYMGPDGITRTKR